MSSTSNELSAHLTTWQSSGLSMAAYCRASGFSYYEFRTQVKRSRNPDPQARGAFIELPRPAYLAPASGSWMSGMASLRLRHGIGIFIPVGTDPAWVGRLVAVVQPC